MTNSQRERELLYKARHLYQKGQSQLALQIVRQVLQSNPASEQGWLLLAYLVRKDKQKAVYCLQKVLSINPNNQEARLALAKYQSGRMNTLQNQKMVETKVVKYSSEEAMEAGIRQMGADGWKVVNVQVVKEHGLSSCLIIFLALTIVGLVLLLLLLFSAKKVYVVTYQREVVSFNPHYGEAQGKLRKTENLAQEKHKKYSSPLEKFVIVGVFVALGIAALVFALLPKRKYTPTQQDAFSYATGFALKEMYANAPDYYCEGERNPDKAGAYWYLLRVTPLGGNRFKVIGATKAIDRYCVYEVGYFVATVEYVNERGWILVGDVDFSNPCLTVDRTDDYLQGAEDKLVCNGWYPGWKPDPNWSPSSYNALTVATQQLESIPSVTPSPSPSPTPTPRVIPLHGGDIGKSWSNGERRISLLSVYRTTSLNGVRPFGEWHGGYEAGFTKFLVVNLRLERLKPGYEDFYMTAFWLWAYTPDKSVEYQADQYLYKSPQVIRVYYGKAVETSIAFEVLPTSHNFIMCYEYGIAIGPSGKIAGECGSIGNEFKFGD